MRRRGTLKAVDSMDHMARKTIIIGCVLAAGLALAVYSVMAPQRPGRTPETVRPQSNTTSAESAAICARAKELARQGMPKEAQEFLEKNLQTHPNDPALNETFADMVVQAIGPAAYERVLPYYQRANASAPDQASVAQSLATIYFALNRPGDAENTLQKAIAANSGNATLHGLLADALARQKKYDAAGKEFDVASALAPTAAELPADWGLMLLDAGHPHEAEQQFRKAVDLDKKSARYQVYLGRSLRDQGRLGSALNAFDDARTLDDKYALAFVESGNTLLRMNQEEDAEANFRAALHVDPHDIQAQVALARLLLSSADPARRNLYEALTLLQQAVAATHESDVSLLVAYAQGLGEAKQYEQALVAIDKAIALGQGTGLTPPQMEMLRAIQLQYTVAMKEPLPRSNLNLSATGVDDTPMPPIPQPSIGEVAGQPIDLSKPPSQLSPSAAPSTSQASTGSH
jgi:tetratricopeptide (TPR) repeat protein